MLFLGANVVYGQAAKDPAIEALIDKMTIEEKVGQMTQLNLDVISTGEIYQLVEPHKLDTAKLRKAIVDYHVGSILNCGGHAYTREHWLDIITDIQKMATQQTRLGIPVIYGIDAIHGANYTLGSTLFPQPIGQAATFNPKLAQEAAAITAYEVRASGITWNFSPVLDVMRQPLWSRVFETYGEDVLVSEIFAAAIIRGYQGMSISEKDKVAACMKHFVGYSASRTGKDRTPAYIPEIMMREYFLPPFQAAIREGAATVMINSGEVNGIPVHADKSIVTDLLRTELGFDGVAVTDWEDIMKLQNIHHVAPTLKDAVKLAIDAGIDMSMVPNDYRFSDLLIELVKEGAITEERLDVSVRRILTLKKQLGLFAEPLPPSVKDFPNFGSAASAIVSRVTAEESITLLKNSNNILPLSTSKKIFITGPTANSLTALNGAWTRTWQGTDTTWNDERMHTVVEGLKIYGGDLVRYVNGCTYNEIIDPVSSLKAAKEADIIIACMGEMPQTEKPGDISSLDLDVAQIEYVKMLHSTGKPVILVMIENRPRIIRELVDMCDGIILAYLPGDHGGDAIANVIYGRVNPSGKLPYTYPKYANDLVWYDHKSTETLDRTFGNNAFDPQWEFGYGLSYTSFAYSDLVISSDTLRGDKSIKVSITVSNTGPVTGKEVVMLFTRDHYGSITPAVKKLRAFDKVEIRSNESKTIEFNLTKNDLDFVNAQMDWVTEEGWFDVMIGGQTRSFYYSNK